MQHLGLLFSLAIVAVNIWGMMLLAGFYWRNRWLALAAGPWLSVTGVYAIECHWGLGRSLPGLGLSATLVSGALIFASASSWEPARLRPRVRAVLREWRVEFAPRRLLDCFGVCAALFLYALAWRFTYPNVDGSSEKIADLSYICSYYTGATLPVPDAWLHPYLSTQYYSFQHYAAALMGRVLVLPPGSAYNIGFCLMIALGGTAMAGVVFLTAKRAWVRILIVLGFTVGGSGLTGMVHLIDKNINPWSSMRFIGSATMDRAPLGPWLKAYAEHYKRMELPGEPFSYSIYLGDYHAPLSSYYLLGLGAMAMILWARFRQRRYVALMGCTLTWTLLANTWDLPLQALGILAWLAVNLRDWRRVLPPLFAGAASVWLAAWVYLSAFTASAAGYDTALRLVPWSEHTPPLLFALFLLPSLGLILMALLSGKPEGRKLGQLWLLFFVVSEFVFVDDVYSGEYNRFNTTLKWWPWMAAGTLITLGPFVLERARSRWVRIVGCLFCFYPCFYALDLWPTWRRGPKDSMGHIEGHYFLTKEEFPRLMLGRLKNEKPGVVAERPEKEGFTNSACIPLFAGQRMWMGWMGHEMLWRAFRDDLRKRQDRLFQLFNGQMAGAGDWLAAQGIDYVLWYRPGDTVELWDKVNASIGSRYVWCEIVTEEDGRKAGYWKRPPAAGP